VHRIIRSGSFIVRFNGILHSIPVFRGYWLLHCGELLTNLVEWCVDLRNLFETEFTTIVILIILATLAITQ
jgi:hypothetical protein